MGRTEPELRFGVRPKMADNRTELNFANTMRASTATDRKFSSILDLIRRFQELEYCIDETTMYDSELPTQVQ